jgi:hypothetical protein
MKKLSLTLLSLILISGGWFLEVYYYQFRFVGDGTPFWIAIIIGVSLTILLSSLFIMDNLGAKVGRVILICLSVWFTWAGQNYSYNQSQNINSVKNTNTITSQQKDNKYTVRITELENTIQQKNSMLPDNLKDRTWLNKNGVQPLLIEIDKLREDLKYYETLRDALDLSTVGNINKSAYEMIAEDLGLNSPTPLKILSQVVLSLFIALMAPSGIKILSTVYAPPKGKVKRVEKKAVVETQSDGIDEFTFCRYRGVDNPPSLLGRTEVMKQTGISYGKFAKFIADEKKYNLVRSTGNMTIPNVSRSEYIMLMRNKQVHSKNLSAVLSL